MHKRGVTIGGLAGCALILALAGCSTGGAPVDPQSVRELLDYQLFVIQTGMERENVQLASTPIDDRFTMDSNVCIRYSDLGWDGRGPQSFRSFLSNTFNLHANIGFELILKDMVQEGDLATATVQTSWRSQRTDIVPPGQYAVETDDYFFFQRSGAAWRLLRWQETPDPPPPFE
jgi:hypothetical protein